MTKNQCSVFLFFKLVYAIQLKVKAISHALRYASFLRVRTVTYTDIEISWHRGNL